MGLSGNLQWLGILGLPCEQSSDGRREIRSQHPAYGMTCGGFWRRVASNWTD